ncbi:MAG: T9SS type A sorting domain-containing protein, partial [Candidatus Marinimicrobia bacterium]|nr:T9SS type A sorting domain-containing protein [Candidatus Neomarinimicrobiota bacterium]
SGAYPPGQGTPIPQVLLDTGTFPLIVMDASTPPDGFKLSQNFPNPFNPSTKITFSLKTKGHTTLTVYNTVGQLVATLVDETMGTGTYHATFDARELPSGVYFYQIKSGEFAQVKKMILMK